MGKKGKQAQDLQAGDKTETGRVIKVTDEGERINVITSDGRGGRTQENFGRTERT